MGEEHGLAESAAELLQRSLDDEHLCAGGDARTAVLPRDAERLRVLTQHELFARRLAPPHGLRLRHRRRRRQRRIERVDTAEQPAELEAPEDLLQRGAVRR